MRLICVAVPPLLVIHVRVWPCAPCAAFVQVCDGPEFLVRHGGCPDRALLLCWARHDMGEASLAAYRGDTVVAVGEVDEGATWELKTWKHPEWRQVRRVPLPNWLGIRDDLRVYRRVAGQKEEEGGE